MYDTQIQNTHPLTYSAHTPAPIDPKNSSKKFSKNFAKSAVLTCNCQ
jgi:hypothetical protein